MVSQKCLLHEAAGNLPLYFPIPGNKTVGVKVIFEGFL
jgi:hypothetical protein